MTSRDGWPPGLVRILLAVLMAAAFAVFVAASQAATPTTTRITVSTGGVQQNRDAGGSDISGNGNLVVFSAQAANLVANDSNGKSDIFLRDVSAGTTHRVSISSSGAQSNGPSYDPSISADGRYIAFQAAAPNLVANDSNQTWDIYVRDTVAHTLRRVSTTAGGGQANGGSLSPQISRDGRFVVFHSFATNLIANDHNVVADVYRKNLQTGAIQRASVSSTGVAGDRDSVFPQISPDGRYVAFESEATDLVSNDLGFEQHQVYVRDMQAGTTTLVSQSSAGATGNDRSTLTGYPFTADGRSIVFTSRAFNLVASDPNDGNSDVFVRDTQLGTTRQVDFGTSGAEPVFGADTASISSDGRYVLFSSSDDHLVANDANQRFSDVFIRDRSLKTTTLVSRSTTGVQGNGDSFGGVFSADGRFFLFASRATNLVSGDSNGHVDVFRRGPLH